MKQGKKFEITKFKICCENKVRNFFPTTLISKFYDGVFQLSVRNNFEFFHPPDFYFSWKQKCYKNFRQISTQKTSLNNLISEESTS